MCHPFRQIVTFQNDKSSQIFPATSPRGETRTIGPIVCQISLPKLRKRSRHEERGLLKMKYYLHLSPLRADQKYLRRDHENGVPLSFPNLKVHEGTCHANQGSRLSGLMYGLWERWGHWSISTEMEIYFKFLSDIVSRIHWQFMWSGVAKVAIASQSCISILDQYHEYLKMAYRPV